MGFKNALLTKLFQGVLENHDVKIAQNLLPIESISGVLDFLPISLSERQRQAVINAWISEISYIQGPPGTGKSHTITAIMLAAVFLNLRVLLVSHKRAAVEIVRKMLEGYLGRGSVVHLGPLTEQKKALRGELQRWCDGAWSLETAYQIHEKRSKRDKHSREVATLLVKVKKMEADLKTALTAEKDFFASNELFLGSRNEFLKSYKPPQNQKLSLADRIKNFQLYANHLDRVHDLLQNKRSASSGQLTRREWLYIKRIFAACVENYFADASLLSPDPGATLYLRDHLDLTLAHEATVNSRLKISANFLQQQRRSLTAKLVQLEKVKKDLVKAQFSLGVAENVSRFSQEISKFDRMLHWRHPRRISEVMAKIDYDSLTKAFPLWLGEMRHLGEFLPFASELFDLVIVDEASQVNIAEIIPAFYRGKRFCVVGDKKQLGLNSAGLFALNQTFEQLIWNQHFSAQGVGHKDAEERSLLVSKSSILDFITSNNLKIPKATLNEHYRSLPKLACFTSDRFYADEGGLLLMREVPKNVQKECFCAIEVGGERCPENKVVYNEVEELLRRLKYLIRKRGYLEDNQLRAHGFTPNDLPTLGVISFLTNQRNYIQTRVEEEFQEDEIASHALMVGTPEDFQGNERHIMFITLGLDGISRWNKGHYENAQRFNVATSRAINFTYFIFGRMPGNADLIKRYLRHFGESWTSSSQVEEVPPESNPAIHRYAWRYNPDLRESEFEIRVDECLHEFIAKHGGPKRIKIYNQVGASVEPGVTSCGQKRLDFVLYNEENGECCAVEVDGCDHFCRDGRSYSEAHLERVGILKRAGWKIAHVPYYQWYQNGWLCDQTDSQFQLTIERTFSELRSLLGISV